MFVQESLRASVLGVLCGCVGGCVNDGCSPIFIGGVECLILENSITSGKTLRDPSGES